MATYRIKDNKTGEEQEVSERVWNSPIQQAMHNGRPRWTLVTEQAGAEIPKPLVEKKSQAAESAVSESNELTPEVILSHIARAKTMVQIDKIKTSIGPKLSKEYAEQLSKRGEEIRAEIKGGKK